MRVTVYPTSKNATNIKHPTDGPLKESGSDWNDDGFTARMLTDGAATLNISEAYSSSAQAPAPSTPTPAPSTK